MCIHCFPHLTQCEALQKARWFCPGLSGNETIASLCFENRLCLLPWQAQITSILQRTLSLLMLWVWHQVIHWKRVRLLVLMRAFLRRLILLIWDFSHNVETWTILQTRDQIALMESHLWTGELAADEESEKIRKVINTQVLANCCCYWGWYS